MTPLAELDGAALLRAVIDEPADDLPRLAYADWLEETGRPEWAERPEYIRLMLRHPRRADHVEYWRGNAAGSPVLQWPDSVYALTGGNPAPEPAWRRGFVAGLRCTLAEWLAHGPALAAAHPLQEVRLSDRQPARLAFQQQVVIWRWYELPASAPAGLASPDDLPGPLFDAVHEGRGGRLPFDSEAEAVSALSRGCIALARAAGQKPQS
jgi:uncharacterized protein (TIGR02996 family)